MALTSVKGIIINVSKVLTVYPLKYNFSNNQIKQKLCVGMATICVTQMIYALNLTSVITK